MATTAGTASHLIMTYCALLALAVLRDDYAQLDRDALKRMVGSCQDTDGGYVVRIHQYLSSPRTCEVTSILGLRRTPHQIRDDARSG